MACLSLSVYVVFVYAYSYVYLHLMPQGREGEESPRKRHTSQRLLAVMVVVLSPVPGVLFQISSAGLANVASGWSSGSLPWLPCQRGRVGLNDLPGSRDLPRLVQGLRDHNGIVSLPPPPLLGPAASPKGKGKCGAGRQLPPTHPHPSITPRGNIWGVKQGMS